jgi:hypothetical protein
MIVADNESVTNISFSQKGKFDNFKQKTPEIQENSGL